jgi:hypothetical protein
MRLNILLPSVLNLQAQALRALNRADEAYVVLVDARKRAEAMRSRCRVLPVLFTLIEMETERGEAAQAERVRQQSREVADYIAAHRPEDLRKSFLNLPNVRKVMSE